jgi:hypothetical protein
MSSSFDLASLLTSAALLSALAAAPACSSGDVPIGENGTNPKDGNGTLDGGGAADAGGEQDGGSGAQDADTACTADTDCPTNYHCLYAIADECSARAQCVAPTLTAQCTLVVNSCACDGTNVDTGCTIYPEGFAPKPIATPGVACNGGTGADGGTLPSDCTTDADCADGYLCGYQEALACAAKGTCLVEGGGAMCNSESLDCACDGTLVNTICGGLPQGYTSKPVLYPLEATCPTK